MVSYFLNFVTPGADSLEIIKNFGILQEVGGGLFYLFGGPSGVFENYGEKLKIWIFWKKLKFTGVGKLRVIFS